MADTALSSNVALLNNTQTVTGLKTFNPYSSELFPVASGKTGMVVNLNAERVRGQNLTQLDIRYGRVSPVQNPWSNTITTVDSVGSVGWST